MARSYSPVGKSVREDNKEARRDDGYLQAAWAELSPCEEIARMVIRLRMDNRLSQEALAKKAKVTRQAICRLESGYHQPGLNTLRRVFKAVGRELIIGHVPAEQGKSIKRTNAVLAKV